jgi:hypothetical protein
MIRRIVDCMEQFGENHKGLCDGIFIVGALIALLIFWVVTPA